MILIRAQKIGKAQKYCKDIYLKDGIEVRLSNNHTCKGVIGRFVDICDDLAGVYPKDFKFVGWHPHCRCFAISKLADRKEIDEYQRKIIDGEDVSNYHFKGEVKDLPRNFKDWYTDNTDRIANAKSQPYFLRDNQELIKKRIANVKSQPQLMSQRKTQLQEELDIVSLNRKIFDSFDTDKWEHTYFNNNNGGFVVTSKDRISTAKINKQEWQKFEKEQNMCHVLADNSYKIQHLHEQYGVSSCDILIDGIKADLKKTSSYGNIGKYARHAIKKQGADMIIFEFEELTPKVKAEIWKLKQKNIKGMYFITGENKVTTF